MKLFYHTPASAWEETLPIGNGSLGAMIWGGVERETLGLNEETLWSGYYKDKNNPHAYDSLQKVRSLIFSGRNKEAELLIQNTMLGEYNESYLPLGTLTLEFAHTEEKAEDYCRELDLSSAKALVSYRLGSHRFTREYFASYPAKAILIRLGADGPFLDTVLRFSSLLQCRTSAFVPQKGDNAPASGAGAAVSASPVPDGIDDDGGSSPVPDGIDDDGGSSPVPDGIDDDDAPFAGALHVCGQCPEHVDPSYIPQRPQSVIQGSKGMRFEARIQVLFCDGQVLANPDGSLTIRGASDCLLAISAVRTPSLPRYEDSCLPQTADHYYHALLQAHIQDYRALYDTVELYLGEQKNLPTDERLRRLQQGEEDNGLYALYFQYGRYLLIASSRTGSLPANLQGIWSWQLRAPWSSNFTININTQMNYWHALSCGLSDCLQPYFHLLARVREEGKKTAATNYHCRGFVAHHNLDFWGNTNPVGLLPGVSKGEDGSVNWAFWPMGGAWLTQELFRAYEYHPDDRFLKDTVYPILKDAALFLNDWLVEQNGCYLTCPSISPENQFRLPDGRTTSVTAGSAMDMAIIREVFSHFETCCARLGIEDPLLDEIREKQSCLAPFSIGSYGQLLEWQEEYEEPEPGHRHVSHLYGLFPSELFETDEALRQACRTSLLYRLAHGGGHTGWSCAWIINLFAVLGDGENAFSYLKTLLVRSTYPNLWDAHPPFQIDGNFGGTAGIANMLVQDRGGQVKILPALPRQFASGYIKGLRLKNNQAIDIFWENGKEVSHRIYPAIQTLTY